MVSLAVESRQVMDDAVELAAALEAVAVTDTAEEATTLLAADDNDDDLIEEDDSLEVVETKVEEVEEEEEALVVDDVLVEDELDDELDGTTAALVDTAAAEVDAAGAPAQLPSKPQTTPPSARLPRALNDRSTSSSNERRPRPLVTPETTVATGARTWFTIDTTGERPAWATARASSESVLMTTAPT